jgi:hypothetical protein
MLRIAVIALGVLYLAIALVLVLLHVDISGLIIYLVVCGLLIAGGVVFERSRYRPQVRRDVGGWQDTGERSLDPTTGRVTKVMYNPTTGERDYVELEATDVTGGKSIRR